ncbi:MAG: IS4 family transposase [Moraxellaceae bacterium]|nr:IS4 family transposase [Moraxellaceae bacterium]
MSLNELGTTGTGGIDLGDKRINKRLIEFVDDSSRHIQSSIAQLGDSRHVSKAYYRLLANDKVDSYAVLEEHLKQVQSRAAKHPVVLCLQDTTELNYSSKQSIEGLGRLCYDAQHGMYVHPTLMVTPEGLPLGITDLWSWSRKPKGEIDIKESTRWKEGYERVCELAQDQPKTRHVYIADREGDLLDIIEAGEHLEHPADYLIRAKHSRILADETKLFSITTEAYELGKLEFTTPRGRGKAARQVIQTVYAKRVQLKSKHWITIVIAQEAHPPKGSQAVVWRLITNRLVGDFLAA